jgi:hypothetical protein
MHTNSDNRSVPEFGDDPAPSDVALAMARAGFRVGPLIDGTKNPGSMLGKSWPTRTSADPKQIVDWYAGMGQIGVFLHCVGLVVFDVDRPDLVPDWMWQHLDTAPMISTRRDGDPRRGHYIFAAPDGRRLGNSLGKLPRGWGEVRGAGGVIVLPGTGHERADGHYLQRRAGVVPVLPAQIADQLPDADDPQDAASEQTIRRFVTETASNDTGRLGVSDDGPITEFTDRGADSRHEACVRAACWIAREAAAGAYPALPALKRLRREFLGSFTEAERARGRGEAEWDRIAGYAIGQLTSVRVAEERDRLSRSKFDIPDDDDDDDNDGWWRSAKSEAGNDAGLRYSSSGKNLPSEFWRERPAHKLIETAAAARLLSPDAVLGASLAILSSYIRPGVRVETGLGRASLNAFCCLIGDSSSGKSEAFDAAMELLPPPIGLSGMPDLAGLPIGSGEGIAEAYYGMKDEPTGEEYKSGEKKGQPKTRQVRCKMYDHASMYADEGEALVRMMERAGTTIAQVIRSAWKAGKLGQQNAAADRRRIIEKGTYALGLVLAFQPETVGPLLADSAGGTPQRFLWWSAHSSSVGEQERAKWPGPMPNLAYLLPDEDLRLPDEAAEELRADRIARRQPGAEPTGLDGHAPLHLAKLAALLAVLNGQRSTITMDDWRLAKLIYKTSRAVRDGLVSEAAEAEHAKARAADARRVELAARSAVRSAEELERARAERERAALERVTTLVVGKVTKAGAPVPLRGRGGLRDAVAGRDRALLTQAIDAAIRRGEVRRLGDDHLAAPT